MYSVPCSDRFEVGVKFEDNELYDTSISVPTVEDAESVVAFVRHIVGYDFKVVDMRDYELPEECKGR